MLNQKYIADNEEKEIGIALSHYHHKLGPQFVGIHGPLLTSFDSMTQYNVLQDSISSRSQDLALYVNDKNNDQYIIRIKKIKIIDPLARGGIQRYAVILIIHESLKWAKFEIDEIADDIVNKISQGASANTCLTAWYTILNDLYGKINLDEEVQMIHSLEPKIQKTFLDVL